MLVDAILLANKTAQGIYPYFLFCYNKKKNLSKKKNTASKKKSPYKKILPYKNFLPLKKLVIVIKNIEFLIN